MPGNSTSNLRLLVVLGCLFLTGLFVFWGLSLSLSLSGRDGDVVKAMELMDQAKEFEQDLQRRKTTREQAKAEREAEVAAAA